MANIQIDEAAHADLVEKAGRVDALEAQLATTTAERDAAVKVADEAAAAADLATAQRLIGAADGYTFDDLQTAGLIAGMPLTEGGRLDVDAFTKTVAEAAAAYAVEAGAGRIFGHGTPAPAGMTLAEFDQQLARIKEGN